MSMSKNPAQKKTWFASMHHLLIWSLSCFPLLRTQGPQSNWQLLHFPCLLVTCITSELWLWWSLTIVHQEWLTIVHQQGQLNNHHWPTHQPVANPLPQQLHRSSGATRLPSSGSNMKVPPKKLCAISAKTQMIKKSLSLEQLSYVDVVSSDFKPTVYIIWIYNYIDNRHDIAAYIY